MEQKLLGWKQIKERINAGLESPLSHQFLSTRVAPVMREAGDLQSTGRDSVMSPAALDRWAAYIAFRQRMVKEGTWSRVRPYSLTDMRYACAQLGIEWKGRDASSGG